jgi:2-methylcitrate synthase
MASTPIARGLDGVIVDETAVCLADKAANRLFYRGYAIEELAAQASYEEVAYLLMHDDLPGPAALADFRRKLKEARTLPLELRAVLETLPKASDAMDVMRTGCSVLAHFEPETKERGLIDIGVRLLAAFPAMLCYWHHFHHTGKRIETEMDDEGVAGYLLHLLHGKRPDDLTRRAIDVSLIVYAEHDLNASTFAARVATSTLSDVYSALGAAIGTLRGPLHGSANAAVLKVITRFRTPEEAEAGVMEMLAKKIRTPGFGQRAYSTSDPRNAVNKRWAQELSEAKGEQMLYEVSARIEEVMRREKGMFANLDYYTAIIYRMCGLPAALFPPMFLMARVSGLIAHIAEQRKSNRLIHPSSRYAGRPPRAVPAPDERGVVDSRQEGTK